MLSTGGGAAMPPPASTVDVYICLYKIKVDTCMKNACACMLLQQNVLVFPKMCARTLVGWHVFFSRIYTDKFQ